MIDWRNPLNPKPIQIPGKNGRGAANTDSGWSRGGRGLAE